ncbi:MAG: cytochrome c [Polyangiales bacterium]
MATNRNTLAALVLAGAGMAACRGQVSEQSPILIIRDMHVQQKYRPQDVSAYYQDTRSMRPLPANTVSREQGAIDPEVESGLQAGTRNYVDRIPQAALASIRHRTNDGRWLEGMEGAVARGRERYNIYCAPCHGSVGDGQGIIWARSRISGYQYPQPASLHDDRIRHSPDGQLYATIRNGVRNMPGYASQIPTSDRWAIVAYVRALELSQANAGANP